MKAVRAHKQFVIGVLAVLFVLAAGASLYGGAWAATPVNPKVAPTPTTEGPIKNPSDMFGFFQNVLDWVAYAFWLFAAIFIFYAAYTYMVAGGDSEKVSVAHQRLIYAAIAIAIALFAYGMPRLIYNILVVDTRVKL